MDLSGVIFVVLAIVWAVYLIPKALKQGDEVARSRSIDSFSSDTRVVARREPVSRRDARLVVPVPSGGPATSAGTVEPVASRDPAGARRTAAVVAARRRRRILALLLVCDVATAAAAYLGHLPWWSVAVPGGLTVAYLVLCRTQVKRHRTASRRPVPARPAEGQAAASAEAAEPATASSDPVEQPAAAESQAEATEDAVAESAQALPDTAVGDRPEATADVEPDAPAPYADADTQPRAGELWDPVPVTLPTYVTKPKARRTVRTIDLGEPGTWTSGRTPEDAEIAARATDPEPSAEGPAGGGRRAVGS